MTKILFASTPDHTYPILAASEEGVRAEIGMSGCDLGDLVPSEDILHLGPGLHVWEGKRREKLYDDELGAGIVKSWIRPATRQDLDEMGFACPTDTVAPPDSFLAGVEDNLDQMQPGDRPVIHHRSKFWDLGDQ